MPLRVQASKLRQCLQISNISQTSFSLCENPFRSSIGTKVEVVILIMLLLLLQLQLLLLQLQLQLLLLPLLLLQLQLLLLQLQLLLLPLLPLLPLLLLHYYYRYIDRYMYMYISLFMHLPNIKTCQVKTFKLRHAKHYQTLVFPFNLTDRIFKSYPAHLLCRSFT